MTKTEMRASVRWNELNDCLDTKQPANKKKKIIFSLILAVGILGYYLIYANKAFPYAEGWHAYYAELMRAGQVPYRDFFYYLPPLNLLIDSFFWSLSFGSLLVFRLWRLLERLAIIETVYFLLSRYYPVKTVFFACLLGGILGGGSSYDLLGDYNQTAEFLLILTAVFAIRFVNAQETKSKAFQMAGAGIFLGLAFLCKQSTGGLAILLYALFLCAWCFWQRDKKFLRYAIAALIGIVLPIVVAAVALLSMGALPSAIEQIFFGASSKGGFMTMLFGNLGSFYKSVAVMHFWLFLNILIPILVIWGGNRWIFHSKRFADAPQEKKEKNFRILSITTIVLAICVRLLVSILRREILTFRTTFLNCLVLILTAILVYGIVASLIKRKQMLPSHVLVFSVGSYCSIYSAFMASGSAASDLPLRTMYFTFPFLFCLLLGFFAHYKQKLLMIALIFVSTAACLYTFGFKIYRPYHWWGYTDAPIYEKTETVNIHGLEGFRFSPSEKKDYEMLYRLVDQNTDADDVVFGFPYIKVFNLLTDHIDEVGFVPIHFFDVCPDSYAKEDAKRMAENPPDLILWQDLGVVCWNTHEILFREGSRMGQRDIQAWFVSVKNTQYECIGQVGDVYVYKRIANNTPTKFTYFEDGNSDEGNTTATISSCRGY